MRFKEFKEEVLKRAKEANACSLEYRKAAKEILETKRKKLYHNEEYEAGLL